MCDGMIIIIFFFFAYNFSTRRYSIEYSQMNTFKEQKYLQNGNFFLNITVRIKLAVC